MLFSSLLALLCIVLASVLRSRLLFVLAGICWLQNIILPWWYTKDWISESSARSLVLAKEVLLLLLVLYAAMRARRLTNGPLPPPIKWALLFGTYVCARVVLGVLILGEPFGDDVRLIRGMILPAEAILVGFLIGAVAPKVAGQYERFIVSGLAACAVLSLFLYFGTSDIFWVNNVNIALYNLNVKGDPAWTVLPELGVSGSGLGRDVFQALSSFRLIGTFGDPLTAGMVLAGGLILLLARRRLDAGGLVAACLLGSALLFTFSRSAWVFAGAGFLYLCFVQRHFARLGLFVAGAMSLWFLLSGLREFLSSSLAAFDLEAGSIYHAQGILTFYSSEVLKGAYLIGTGPIDASAQSWVFENGLAYMLVQFGLPSLVCFVGTCLSVERYLRRSEHHNGVLSKAAAACAVSTLIVANFSFYALSFTAYYGIWSVIGAAIGAAFSNGLQELGGGLRTEEATRLPVSV